MLPDTVRRIALICDNRLDDELAGYLRYFADADRHVLSPPAFAELDELQLDGVAHQQAETLDQQHWWLKQIGPVDALFLLVEGDGAAHEAAWDRLFFHLAPGGCYVVNRARIRHEGSARPGLFERLSQAALFADGRRDDLAGVPAGRRELADSTAGVLFGRTHLVVRKRHRHLLKVRDAAAGQLLAAREPGLQVTELDARPGGTLVARATVVSHESAVPIPDLPPSMTYPPLHTRAYAGRVAMVSNALLYARNSVLPDSFRHHLDPNPRNVRLIDVNRDFARVAGQYRPRRTLPGRYYHLDSENSGHYGHLTTEVVSRFWGWPAAKRAMPDLKAIFRIRYRNERRPVLEKRFFGALGIAENDVVWTDEPVYLESVVAATPMWHNQRPHYVHPDLIDVWHTIGDRLAAADTPRYDKIFVSRRSHLGNRACRNAVAVEEFFARRGFKVVYPEELDLSLQAGIFAAARVVAGFGGSALFNVMFARRLETMIVLNQEAYTARNEHLFAALLGGELHYFWSTPDVPQPDTGWSLQAYNSAWEFDFARNGPDLARLLAGLR